VLYTDENSLEHKAAMNLKFFVAIGRLAHQLKFSRFAHFTLHFSIMMKKKEKFIREIFRAYIVDQKFKNT